MVLVITNLLKSVTMIMVRKGVLGGPPILDTEELVPQYSSPKIFGEGPPES